MTINLLIEGTKEARVIKLKNKQHAIHNQTIIPQETLI